MLLMSAFCVEVLGIFCVIVGLCYFVGGMRRFPRWDFLLLGAFSILWGLAFIVVSNPIAQDILVRVRIR